MNQMSRHNLFLDNSVMKRILIVRLDEIGDMVLMTPFLREVRRNFPDSHITLLVNPVTYNIVETCPYVNDVSEIDLLPTGLFSKIRRFLRIINSVKRFSLKQRYDLALLPRWDVDYYQATFLAFFSRAKYRLGYSESVTEDKRKKNRGYDKLLTHVICDATITHEAEKNLQLVSLMGGTIKENHLELWTSCDDESYAEEIIGKECGLSKDFIIALAPEAGSPKRIWPVENYIQLATWITQTYRMKIIILGNDANADLGSIIAMRVGEAIVNLVGKTTIRQAFALLKSCKLFIGSDSGPKHLAAAAAIPVIEISCHPQDGSPSHYNSPHRFGAWKVPYFPIQPKHAAYPCRDSCTADFPHCIQQVSVEEVEAAIEMLIP